MTCLVDTSAPAAHRGGMDKRVWLRVDSTDAERRALDAFVADHERTTGARISRNQAASAIIRQWAARQGRRELELDARGEAR